MCQVPKLKRLKTADGRPFGKKRTLIQNRKRLEWGWGERGQRATASKSFASKKHALWFTTTNVIRAAPHSTFLALGIQVSVSFWSCYTARWCARIISHSLMSTVCEKKKARPACHSSIHPFKVFLAWEVWGRSGVERRSSRRAHFDMPWSVACFGRLEKLDQRPLGDNPRDGLFAGEWRINGRDEWMGQRQA